jgi:hypothetical protein
MVISDRTAARSFSNQDGLTRASITSVNASKAKGNILLELPPSEVDVEHLDDEVPVECLDDDLLVLLGDGVRAL